MYSTRRRPIVVKSPSGEGMNDLPRPSLSSFSGCYDHSRRPGLSPGTFSAVSFLAPFHLTQILFVRPSYRARALGLLRLSRQAAQRATVSPGSPCPPAALPFQTSLVDVSARLFCTQSTDLSFFFPFELDGCPYLVPRRSISFSLKAVLPSADLRHHS